MDSISGSNKTTINQLQAEIRTYEHNKERLIAKWCGKYVVISGSEILGVWDEYDVALARGYMLCGLDKPFLVQHISQPDDVSRSGLVVRLT